MEEEIGGPHWGEVDLATKLLAGIGILRYHFQERMS